MDELCRRGGLKRKNPRALGTFLPSPSELIMGPQGMVGQIPVGKGGVVSSDIFDDELATDSNMKTHFSVRFEPRIARTFNGKRTLNSMFAELLSRKVPHRATAADIAAIIKFHRKKLPRRFYAATPHSFVSSRPTSDAFNADCRYYPLFRVDKNVVMHGVREDVVLNGPVLFFTYADTTTDLRRR